MAVALAMLTTAGQSLLAQTIPEPAGALTSTPAASAESGAARERERDGGYDPRDARAAERMLALAREDRALGKAEVAQRLLELLIARYPVTPTADVARRELLEIYAATLPGPAADGRAVPGGAVRQEAEPAAAAARHAPRPGAWRADVMLFPAAQAELRASVGDRVFFSEGSAEIGARARVVIAAQAQWLQRHADFDILVEGHGDDGSAGADSERLAGLRADAVRERLLAEGVAEARIKAVALGRSQPVADCPEPECAAQNRRVVTQLVVYLPERDRLPVEPAEARR